MHSGLVLTLGRPLSVGTHFLILSNWHQLTYLLNRSGLRACVHLRPYVLDPGQDHHILQVEVLPFLLSSSMSLQLEFLTEMGGQIDLIVWAYKAYERFFCEFWPVLERGVCCSSQSALLGRDCVRVRSHWVFGLCGV